MADTAVRSTTSGGAKSGGPGGPPATTTQEPGFITKLVAFYHGMMAEMRKVTWPDVPQVRSATVSIIIFVLILGLLITLLDFVLQGVLIRLIPSLFAGR